jgi:hypothetical protein
VSKEDNRGSQPRLRPEWEVDTSSGKTGSGLISARLAELTAAYGVDRIFGSDNQEPLGSMAKATSSFRSNLEKKVNAVVGRPNQAHRRSILFSVEVTF